MTEKPLKAVTRCESCDRYFRGSVNVYLCPDCAKKRAERMRLFMSPCNKCRERTCPPVCYKKKSYLAGRMKRERGV
ncbi:MAG: hypothetical protein IKT98_03840 [Selenomonadaceae bacterium]|nr:hypothetical protein [Selenomonadaceae bacterium]